MKNDWIAVNNKLERIMKRAAYNLRRYPSIYLEEPRKATKTFFRKVDIPDENRTRNLPNTNQNLLLGF
jgi:hypothetical protein